MAQDAQARLLIIAAVKDLLSGPMREMGVPVEALTADITAQGVAAGNLAQAYRLLDALQGATAASTAEMGRSMGALASGTQTASQALDAFGDYESLVAAEAEGGVRAVREFLTVLEGVRAEVASIKALGPPTFKIGAATAGTADEQLQRQFAAAKTLFGRDLAGEARALQERIEAEKILDPLLRKQLEDERDVAAAIKAASIAEREAVETFVAGEQQKSAVVQRFASLIRAADVDRAQGNIAQMEANAAGAFEAAMRRGAAATAASKAEQEKFTASLKEAGAAEEQQVAKLSDLARALRGSGWQSAIEQSERLQVATRELGAEYVKAAANAQRFFDAQVRRGVAAPVAAQNASGRFGSDLETFRAYTNPNLSGFQKLRAELAAGGVAAREFFTNFKPLKGMFDGINQVAGSTASTLIVFFVAINKIREATAQALEFSRAMSQVASITDLSAAQVGELGKQARQLALNFGLKELDVARGLYFTLSSGIEDTADAMKLVTAANELAVTGFATVEQTIDLLTSTINAYGLTVDDARRLNDLFFTTVRVGKAELPELAHNLGSVLPIASQMGVSLEELTAAVAALTLGGQNADEAVTSIRQLLINLLNPSSDAVEIIGELQAKTTELGDSNLAAAVKSRGLLAVMQALNKTVGDNSARMRELVPDARGFVAVSALAGNQLGVFQRTLDATTNSAGANAKALEKVFVSQAKQIDIVQAGIRQGFLDIGQSIIDGFAPLDGTAEGARASAEVIRDAISSIAPAVSEVTRVVQLLLAGVTALGTIPSNAESISKTLDLKDLEGSLKSFRETRDEALRGGDAGFVKQLNRDIAEMSNRLTTLREEEARASGEAERRNRLLQTLSSFDAADFASLSKAQRESAESARVYADRVSEMSSRLIDARIYLAGFNDEAKDGRAYQAAQGNVEALAEALSKLRAAGIYAAASGGVGDFDKLVAEQAAKAASAASTAREKLLRERNAALGAPLSDVGGDKDAARKAAEEFERIAAEVKHLDVLIRNLKLTNIREEFESSARVAEAFGSKTEKALVTAQEKVRALAREFKASQFDVLAKLNKGDFGASTSDAAKDKAGKELLARKRLFDAQTADAEREVATTRAAIVAQHALSAAFSGTNASMESLADSTSLGQAVFIAFVESLKSAAANAPDFAEAVRAQNFLKEGTDKLKLSKVQEAQAEVASVVAIRRRFEADVDAGKITGQREQQIRSLIETLYDQAAAERHVAESKEQSRAFTALPGVDAGLRALVLQAEAIARLVKEGKTEKELKADLELLDQRRVTTLATESEELRTRLSVMEAQIPVYESLHLLNQQDAEQMRERISLIRETTLAEMEKRAAVEQREQFLKTQGFGGGFTQAFEEMSRTVDEGFERGKIIGDSFFSNLENGFASVVSGATSAKEAFKQFAQSLLADISRMLVRMLLMNTIGNALGGLFGGGGAGGFGTNNSIAPGSLAGSGSGAGTLFAKGGAFGRNGQVYKFADGDIFDRPTRFRFGGGKKGEFGEAGPEAIVPLTRGPGGALGVQAYGLPPEPVVQEVNVSARPDARAFAAQASMLMAASRTFESEITRVGNTVRPGVNAIPIGAGGLLPVEYSGRGAVSRAAASRPTQVNITLHVASLDPRTAGDVVLGAMPQIQKALAVAIHKGESRDLNTSIRAVAGSQ